MTQPHDPMHDATADESNAPPLDSWMLDLAVSSTHDASDAIEVPREMMWRRIQAARVSPARTASSIVAPTRRAFSWRSAASIAAVLLAGVGIGRYSMPRTGNIVAPSAMAADSLASPTRVAMQEHLVRTVALLTTVRDRDGLQGATLDVSSWARELLMTTRLLLDEPALRDDRTRRLLQDLELVLMQIIQSRGTDAPEARRAPTETMRETNLLPRVRAIVTASARRDEMTTLGDDE
jgi:hypothetical protein